MDDVELVQSFDPLDDTPDHLELLEIGEIVKADLDRSVEIIAVELRDEVDRELCVLVYPHRNPGVLEQVRVVLDRDSPDDLHFPENSSDLERELGDRPVAVEAESCLFESELVSVLLDPVDRGAPSSSDQYLILRLKIFEVVDEKLPQFLLPLRSLRDQNPPLLFAESFLFDDLGLLDHLPDLSSLFSELGLLFCLPAIEDPQTLRSGPQLRDPEEQVD